MESLNHLLHFTSIVIHFFFKSKAFPKLTSLIPNSIMIGNTISMIAVGGPFIAKELNVEFRPLIADQYLYAGYNYTIVNGTKQITNLTSSHVVQKALNIQFIDKNTISFSNPILQHDVAFEIFITNNNMTWSLTSPTEHFRSYGIFLNLLTFSIANDRFKIQNILGDSGIGKTTPGGSTIYLEGSGFYPSSKISISYNVSSGTSTGLSFSNVCEFVNSNNVSCSTNNVFKTGVALPLDFDVYFSINGKEYNNTGLKLTFLKSGI
jgi:hypothetical protein